MHYLSEMQNKVYINCLKFWREVQQYKILFVKDAFSPCAVEMKAKVPRNHFINTLCELILARLCMDVIFASPLLRVLGALLKWRKMYPPIYGHHMKTSLIRLKSMLWTCC